MKASIHCRISVLYSFEYRNFFKGNAWTLNNSKIRIMICFIKIISHLSTFLTHDKYIFARDIRKRHSYIILSILLTTIFLSSWPVYRIPLNMQLCFEEKRTWWNNTKYEKTSTRRTWGKLIMYWDEIFSISYVRPAINCYLFCRLLYACKVFLRYQQL